MSKPKLSERIEQGVLFLDGAMGTQLFERGAKAGQCNETLNVDAQGKEIVKQVHTAYLSAGSDAIITNTFGANSVSLSKYDLADQAEEINLQAVGNAIEAVEAFSKDTPGDRYVLGGLGPCGDFIEPLGMVKADDLKKSFQQQAKALADGGVDGFIIETMTAVEEAALAAEAVRSVSDLPVFVSFAFDPAAGDFRTMMGVSPQIVAEKILPIGVDAIGFNCGTLTMDEYIKLAAAFAEILANESVLLLTEPNAGKPELIEGQAKFTLTPQDYATAGKAIKQAGAKIMGGCCGTSPQHIEALTSELRA